MSAVGGSITLSTAVPSLFFNRNFSFSYLSSFHVISLKTLDLTQSHRRIFYFKILSYFFSHIHFQITKNRLVDFQKYRHLIYIFFLKHIHPYVTAFIVPLPLHLCLKRCVFCTGQITSRHHLLTSILFTLLPLTA